MSRVASLVITFWAGSLWTVCGVVAPTLFTVLEDRQMAGRLAATFFRAETIIGVVAGAVLVGLGLAGKLSLAGRLGKILIAVTAAAPLLSQVVLGPFMERARAAGDMARFGMLHGAAALLFLIACFSALLLVWRLHRPAE
ncbi:MAG TPA: DUF4149 domain-containing protein [Steroidobacteraceae bacterium]|jgi:hypothetical protein